MAVRSYTEEERREVLRVYLLEGAYDKVEAKTGVSRHTIASWKHHDREWWDRTCNELITAMEGDYRPGWVRVLGKAIEAIEDRIEHGDTVLTKEGLTKVPVKGKDLGVLAGIAADKLKQFAVKPAQSEDAKKRRSELAELAKQDREASKLAALPVNRPVIKADSVPN